VSDVVVSPLEDADRGWARAFLRERSSEVVAAHGELLSPLQLPGLVARTGDERVGLLTYRMEPEGCEVVSLHSDREGMGAGTALLEEAARLARAAGRRRLWLITTNDNAHALRFYQRRGFRLAALRPGAVDEARRTLKPSIPETGNDGIPIRDELELELPLE
jgi:ribosomal protein S18 acetylase RimI-like enzyme